MKEKQQQLNEEQLNDAVERLSRGESMGVAPSREARMAAQLNAMTSDDTLDSEVDARTEHALLQRFATQKSRHAEHNFADTQRSWLSKLSLVFAPAAAIAFAVIAFVVGQDTSTTTLAQIQGTDSLSRAEELLGELPADTQLTIDVAQLRAEIHAINEARAKTDTTLDPSADLFPHVELRSSALEIIEDEKEVLDIVTLASVDTGALEKNITGFEGAVSKWPTKNEGVSYEVHEDAVNAFKKHDTEWNHMMADLIEELLEKSE